MLGWARCGWLGMILAAAACRPAAENFDATCAVDADCEVVVDVGWCGSCSGMAALSERGAKRYETALAGAVPMCRGIILLGCPSDLTGEPQTASCVDAVCRLDPRAVDTDGAR